MNELLHALLAEFFGINLDTIEAEKRAMLDAQRASDAHLAAARARRVKELENLAGAARIRQINADNANAIEHLAEADRREGTR